MDVYPQILGLSQLRVETGFALIIQAHFPQLTLGPNSMMVVLKS